MVNTTLSPHDREKYQKFFKDRIIHMTHYCLTIIETEKDNNTQLSLKSDLILRTITFALKINNAWQNVHHLIEIFSPYMERWGQWEIWQTTLKNALTIAYRLNDTVAQLTLSALLTRLTIQQGNLRQARGYARQTICLARQQQNLFRQAQVWTNLGFLYACQGYTWRAEILCCVALTLFQQLNSHYGLAHTHNHLGVLYDLQHHWPKAEHHLTQAYTLWQTMDNKLNLLNVEINLGILYAKMEKTDQAKQHLQHAHQKAKQFGNQAALAKIYLNLGLTHRIAGDLTQAETYIWQAERIYRPLANLFGLAQVKANLGVIYRHQKKWPQAITTLTAALKEWREMDYKQREVETLLELALCEKALTHTEQAAQYLHTIKTLLTHYQSSHWAAYIHTKLNKIK